MLYLKYASHTLLLLASIQTAYAIPYRELAARDVAHIGVDDEKREYVAYKRDGSIYARYPIDMSTRTKRAGRCVDIPLEELKTVPGWSKIEQYADDNWGTGGRNIVANPEEYSDRPTQACVSDEVIHVEFDKNTKCDESTTSTKGTVVGTQGEATVEVTQGFSSGVKQSITKASTIGVSSTFSVQVGLPEIAEVTASLTTSVDVTNAEEKTIEASHSTLGKTSLKIEAPEGKTCSVKITLNSCNKQAKGRLRYLATGWVWFNYKTATKGHYKWAASIENALTNQDDRSSFAEFSGSMSTESYSNYEAECV